MDKSTTVNRNIGEILSSLEDLSKKISPIEIPKEPGLKTTLLRIFTSCCSINQSMSDEEAWNEHLAIRSLLEDEYLHKHNKIESFLSSSPRQNNVESFVNWINNKGVDTSKLKIFLKENNEFGLKTVQQTLKGDILLRINREIMLTAEDIKVDNMLENFISSDPLISSMPNVCLAFGLVSICYRIMDKIDENWLNYVRILPSVYNNVCFFSVQDFENLRNTSVFIESLALWKSIVRQYAYAHLRLLSFSSNDEKISNHINSLANNFTLSDYRWAAATVMTRANSVPSKDSQLGVTLSLIPFLDMCNHSTGLQSNMYNPTNNSCELSSPVNFDAEKEFFIFYGARPTSHYVLHNGFFFNDSPHDFTLVPMSIEKTDPLEKEKLEILKKLGLTIMKGYPISVQVPPWFGDVVAFLRIKVASKETIDEILLLDNESLKKKLFINNKSIKKISENDESRISIDNDTAAIKYFISRLETMIQPLNLTHDGDINRMNKENSCLTIKIRCNEYNIVHSSLEKLKELLS